MLAVWLVAAWILLILPWPFIRYLQDPKGLRKYPSQNIFSGLTGLAYGWEAGRRHRVFHTRRPHEQLVRDPVVRIGPGWLMQGTDLTLVTRPDGLKEYANIIDCMHSSSRANATLVWDAASFPMMKKLTNFLSPWYASQWHNASNWAAYIDQITAERVERGEKGEGFHDLSLSAHDQG
ncbi:benzoate 4-monooxygenase cytochrome P450 [Colletotrichum higginsianum]|nr:benzoate 4-monooxygenase cytochrome P450 [Colletotrichum higginsianum]